MSYKFQDRFLNIYLIVLSCATWNWKKDSKYHVNVLLVVCECKKPIISRQMTLWIAVSVVLLGKTIQSNVFEIFWSADRVRAARYCLHQKVKINTQSRSSVCQNTLTICSGSHGSTFLAILFENHPGLQCCSSAFSLVSVRKQNGN